MTVKNARQWNDFAQSYNDEALEYAAPLTVLIDGAIDFGGLSFVPINRLFTGVISGTGEVGGYTEEAVRQELLFPGGWEHWSGFYNITLENGLFEGNCGNLTIENIAFCGIHANSSSLIAGAADSLTMRNIAAIDCSSKKAGALFIREVGSVEVENMFLSRCNITMETEGGGIFQRVYGDAAFSRVGVVLSHFLLLPDGGGSGHTAGAAGLLATKIEGNASFNRIGVYNCSMYSLRSVVLCHTYGNLSELRDITVKSSSFLGFPTGNNSFTGSPENGMLFGVWNSHTGHDILLQDSMFNVYGSFEDYYELGCSIKNCISVEEEQGLP